MWPEPTRFARIESLSSYLTLELPGHCSNKDCEKFMSVGDEIGFFKTRKFMTTLLLEKIYTCPIIHLDWMLLAGVDRARDLSHAGIESNQRAGIRVSQIINSKTV